MYVQHHETFHSNLTRRSDVLLKGIKFMEKCWTMQMHRQEKRKPKISLVFPQDLAMEGINEKKPHVCISVVLYI